MEEMDLIKNRKDLEKNYYKNHKREVISAIGTPSITFLGSFYNIENTNLVGELCTIPAVLASIGMIGYNAKHIKLDARRFAILEQREMIRKTDTYKRLKEYYQSYLENLSMFFKSQGIQNYKDVNLYYQELLDLGCLSYNKEYSYDSDMLSALYAENECEEIWGARVASGKAVCRHTSSELKDLQNKLGNQATNLILKPEFQKDQRSKGKDLHCINVFYNDDGICFYDSTNRVFLDINLEGEKQIVSPIPYSEDLSKKRLEIMNQIVNSRKEINHFFQETKCELGEINNLYNRIAPLTKEKVKSLRIR